MEVAARPGTIVDERYQLERLLGEGGHGSVWLATDIHLKRHVALKMVSAFADDGQIVARLQREAKALQRLEHPNIVQVFRVGAVDENHYFLALEYVEGTDLDHLLADGALPVHEALRIALQVCDAMCEAEKRGLIHRDLKPHNILVIEGAQPGERVAKVADFGLCKTNQEATLQFGALTQAGTALGTPLYMSPEQCRSGAIDVRSDIYSFGCVLFEMITGEPPFEGDSAAAIMMKQVHEPIPHLVQKSGSSQAIAQLDKLISKCTAKDPKDRYQSFNDVRAELATISGGDTEKLKLGVKSQRQPFSQRPAVAFKIVLGLAAATVALGAAACGFWVATNDEQKGQGLTWLAQTTNPNAPQFIVLSGVRLVRRTQGDTVAIKLAEGTVLSEQFRQWPPAVRSDLLEWYIRMFSQDDTTDGAGVFANHLLDENFQLLAKHAAHFQVAPGQKVDPAEEALATSQLKLLLNHKWSHRTWQQFAQTIAANSGVSFQINRKLPYAVHSYLIQEFMAETILQSNERLSAEQLQQAADFYFDASGRACMQKHYDSSRRYIERLKQFKYPYISDAKLALVRAQHYYGDSDGARRDLEALLALLKDEPFRIKSSKTICRDLQRQLLPASALVTPESAD